MLNQPEIISVCVMPDLRALRSGTKAAADRDTLLRETPGRLSAFALSSSAHPIGTFKSYTRGFVRGKFCTCN